MSTEVQNSRRYTRSKLSDFSIGAGSLSINKRNSVVGLTLNRVFIAFIVFMQSINVHTSKVRYLYYMIFSIIIPSKMINPRCRVPKLQLNFFRVFLWEHVRLRRWNVSTATARCLNDVTHTLTFDIELKSGWQTCENNTRLTKTRSTIAT